MVGGYRGAEGEGPVPSDYTSSRFAVTTDWSPTAYAGVPAGNYDASNSRLMETRSRYQFPETRVVSYCFGTNVMVGRGVG